MKSKIIQLSMTIVLLLSFIPASAYDFEVDGIYYTATLSNMSCTVVAGDNPYEGDIVIPSKVIYKDREFTVAAIEGAFTSCKSLNSVSVPKEVTVLSEKAFYNCVNLASVNGLNGVEVISNDCFLDCSALQTIDLTGNNSLKSIGDNAFKNCISLKEISIPNSVYEIGSYAFAGCTNIEQIDLPENLSTISEGLCQDCKSLSSISIPETVTEIHSHAFENCESITSLVIPSNVIEIKDLAFWNLKSLNSCIILDSNATLKIGGGEKYKTGSYWYDDYPMFYRSPIQSVYMGRNISSDSNLNYTSVDCFSGNDYLTDVVFSHNVTYIDYGAFSYCDNLQIIIIPNSVIGIYENAFKSSGIKSLNIEDGYTYLNTGHNAFYNTKIEEIYLGRNINGSIIPNTLEKLTIGNYVDDITKIFSSGTTFSDCPDLEYIQFGINIASIPDLSNNSKLTQLRLVSNNPPSCSSFSDSQYMDTSLEVPEGSLDAYKSAPIWQNFWEIKEDENLFACFEDNGLLYQIEENSNLTVIRKYDKYCGDIIVPEEVTFNGKKYMVTSIGEAFSDCPELLSVSLPESVTKLQNGCFKGCSNLTTVTLGKEINEIPVSAFEDCVSLSTFPLSDNIKHIRASAFQGCVGFSTFECGKIESLGQAAFKNCSNLETISMPSSLTSLPSELFAGCSKLNIDEISALNIGDRCFEGCESITDVNLPNVVTIGEESFKDCSSLIDVNLPNVVTIGEGAFKDCSSLASINLGQELTKLSNNVFYGCKSLSSLALPGSLQELGESVFSGCYLKELRFEDGDNTLVLPSGKYDNATSIQKKEINGKLVQFKITYYKGIFNGLNIEKLYLGRNLSDSPRYTISGNGGVDYYNIVTYDNPFYNLPKLKELTIGENVSVLGPKEEDIKEINSFVSAGSFKKCSALEKVTVLNPVPPTGAEFSSAVYGKAVLNVPEYSVSRYQTADGWKEFVNYFVPATEITLNETEISIEISEQYQLTATVLPENATSKEVEWSSSNENVATVDENGLVTIVSEGFCTIYAKTTDGSDLTVECFVTGVSGIEEIIGDERSVDVYGVDGRLILKNASVDEFKVLQRGLYIVNGKKVCKSY